jgi:glycosyltransferase involved in cell wall biosynthesis
LGATVKITFYAHPKVYGGLMRHIELLSKELSVKHQVGLIIPSAIQREFPSGEAPLARLDLSFHIVKGKWDWRGWFRLFRFLKKTRPDIFHLHLASPGESTLPILASHFAGIPVTVTTEHSPSYFPLEKFYSKWIKQFSQRFVNLSIALSESGQQLLIRKYAVDPEKMRVVYNGVPIQKSLPEEEKRVVRESLGIRKGSSVITAISEITEKKGVDLLIQAVEPLIQKKLPVQLLVIGEGPLKRELQNRYRQFVESHDIHFLGYQKDVRSYLSISDLFVLPSLGEELPFSILESMAAKVPVIATDVGGIPEIIKHGENGWIVKPGDAHELTAALSYLMNDKTMVQQLAANALRLVQTKFSLSAMVEQTEEIYRTLLAGR